MGFLLLSGVLVVAFVIGRNLFRKSQADDRRRRFEAASPSESEPSAASALA